MSFVWKRRAVLAILVLLTAWPLAHRGLVARYEISPWRLFGWAMYCTPILAIEVGVVPERDGRPVEIALPADVRQAVYSFTERRKALGRLARVEPLAAKILDEIDVDSLVLTIQRNRLDPRSARILGRREYYRFRRESGGQLVGRRFAVRELP